MRHYHLSLLAAGAILLATSLFAAEESPYEAIVLDQGAAVRSGPGLRFYVTQELEPGARVEVYRRDAGDWLAIRPPEGSFSWIPEADLEMTEEPGIAEVTSEEAKSWLGSRAERIRQHQSHVSLARGERVEVLGKKQVEGADGKSQLWLKIAPPAGEFRWVNFQQVRKVKKSELAAKDARNAVKPKAREEVAAASDAAKTPATVDVELPRAVRSYILLSDLQPVKPEPEPKRDERYPVRKASHEEPVAENPAKSLSPDGFVPRKGRPSAPPLVSGSAPRSTSPPIRNSADRTAAAKAPPPARVSSDSNDEVSRELDELDLQLSLALARDKSTWNFAALKERAQHIVDTAATPGERGQARFMLDKIKRFEETFDVQPLPEQRTAPPVAAKTLRTYDGQGWLTAIKSSDKPVAPYALVDADGKRICFVTPAPGMSVSSHLDKRVGIYGKRGLIPDLNEAHVVASRVIDLDRLR